MVVMRTQRARLALPHTGRINGVGSFYLTILLCTFICFPLLGGNKEWFIRFSPVTCLVNPEKHLLAHITTSSWVGGFRYSCISEAQTMSIELCLSLPPSLVCVCMSLCLSSFPYSFLFLSLTCLFVKWILKSISSQRQQSLRTEV